jgi:hypothetical protein
LTLNQWVQGSIPCGVTTWRKSLQVFGFEGFSFSALCAGLFKIFLMRINKS